LPTWGKIRRDSAGHLAVTSVEVKYAGNWCIPGKKNNIYEREAEIRFSYEFKR
jgi:hypothetical protein